MAGDKKSEKKEETGWNFTPTEFALVIIFLLAALAQLVPFIYNYISSGEITFYGFALSRITDFFIRHALLFKIIGLVLAFAGFIGTVILNKKKDAIWAEEQAKLYPAEMPIGQAKAADNQLLTRWQEIVLKSESNEPANWRVAIIEADIMLDELLQQMRLPGETIGDRLKAVEPSDFNTLDYAWEAHKARNMIAHEGSNFLLNQRETRRIIALYGAVFKEFEMI